jgi:putative DNA primase/helicase
VTPERLGTILADNDERMAWLSSEGGIFEIISGRYSGGIPNLDLFLKAHAGDAEKVDRGCRPPVYLLNPLLTIGLSPQPDVLRGLASKPGFLGRGLLARFLYLLPPSPLGYRTGEAQASSEDCEDKYTAGLTAILNMPSAVNAEGKPVAHILRLSRAAHAEWREFDRHNEKSMRPGGDFENAKGWAGKAPGAAVRIAGVLHVMTHIEPWSSEISVETMNSALELMAVFGKHTLAALDLMGADKSVAAARRIWDWMESGHRNEVSLRDIHQALKGSFPHAKDVKSAIDVLVERGYLELTEVEAKPTGRPPSPTVVVRPDIVAGWR